MEESLDESGWQIVSVEPKRTFRVPENLTFIKKVGSSAYRVQASFSKPDGSKILVDKISDAYDDLHDANNMLQEIRLMRKLKHPNLSVLQDMYPPESLTSNDIYLVWGCMDMHLHRVIQSKCVLSEQHHQYLCCQILCGLRYLHAAKVVHYDLKPANILVNKDCLLKIRDFRKARPVGPATFDDSSECVVCRWYCAPEVLLLREECRTSSDIWSVGCILCELIGRKAIFRGRDIVDQIKRITEVVGSPSEGELDWLPLKSPALTFMKKRENSPKQPWPIVYPRVGPSAHEALEALLTFHPHHRIDAAAALQLSYFEEFREERHFVINCHECDRENVRCTTLSGDLIGTFHVPEGEQMFDSWLAKKVVEVKPNILESLSFINPAGEVFYTRHYEEGSEPIEESLDWIFDTPSLTKELLETEVCRELQNFRPWSLEQDQQVHDMTRTACLE